MNDEDSLGQQCRTTHRRVPPSQRNLDRDRAAVWNSDKDSHRECDASLANDVKGVPLTPVIQTTMLNVLMRRL